LQEVDVSSRASASTPLVSGVRLIAHQQYSELQLKIHSEDLGEVQIRATMREGQIGAAITAERPEAREALSSAMPALHQALRDRDVRVEQISVIDRSQASNDFNLGSGSQQSGTPQQNKQNITQASYSPAEGFAVTSAETERPVVNESALVDIHA
jgi:flagellar hook-length control protein FliK